MKFCGTEDTQVQDVCSFLLCLDIVGARGEKNKI